jgi:hypothetical protein
MVLMVVRAAVVMGMIGHGSSQMSSMLVEESNV